MTETMKIIGVKADGTEHDLGTMPMSPMMKARLIAQEYFGSYEEGDGSDADLCADALKSFADWLLDQGWQMPEAKLTLSDAQRSNLVRNARAFEMATRGLPMKDIAAAAGITKENVRLAVIRMRAAMLKPSRLGTDKAPLMLQSRWEQISENPHFWRAQLKKWCAEHQIDLPGPDEQPCTDHQPCRDCADFAVDGICPNSGKKCGT